MKNRIITITVMGAMLIGSYFLGATQTKTVTEVKTIEKERLVEVIPDNYINMEDVSSFTTNGNSLQLNLNDGTGYYWEGENTINLNDISYWELNENDNIEFYLEDGTTVTMWE